LNVQSALIDREFSALGRCTENMPEGDALALFSVTLGADGTITRVFTDQSTLTDCEPLSCIRAALVDKRIASPPAKSAGHFTEAIALRRGSIRILDPPEVIRKLASVAKDTMCSDPRDGAGARLPPEMIRDVVRSNSGLFRTCYEAALGRDPSAKGLVTVRFVVGLDGRVTGARIVENTLGDCVAARCVRDQYRSLTFPKPQGGQVTVIYPLRFEPLFPAARRIGRPL
jgi:hypothetical protein